METKQQLPVVLRIEPEKIAGSWKWEKNAKEIPSDLMIADKEYLPEYLKTLIPSPEYGHTYLKSPFEDKYFRVEEYEKKVLESKIGHIVSILQLLGASSIKYETIEVGRKQREIDNKLNGAISKLDLDAGVKKEEEERNKRKNSKEWKYQGSSPNYEKAYKYAESHNLTEDCVVKTLLDGRKPENNNLQTMFTETSYTSAELNKTLDIAYTLNYLRGVVTIDNAFKEHTSMCVEVQTTFVVEF